MKYISILLLMTILAIGCGKQSAVEGILVYGYGKNKPVAGIKIIALQVKPIKGYEQKETVTGSDGTFRIIGLYPSSLYILRPWSNKWATNTEVKIESAPQGETAVLPSTLVIDYAYSKENGNTLVSDLSSGATRFVVSSMGVITDSKTNFEWVVGPIRGMSRDKAEQWVADCKVAGGGWRIPTLQELRTLYLYQKNLRDQNKAPLIDPVFNETSNYTRAEQDWGFCLFYAGEMRLSPNDSTPGLFAVRGNGNY